MSMKAKFVKIKAVLNFHFFNSFRAGDKVVQNFHFVDLGVNPGTKLFQTFTLLTQNET